MEPGVFLPAINKCDVKSNLRLAKKIITQREVKKGKKVHLAGAVLEGSAGI